jgi:hypothetical protein
VTVISLQLGILEVRFRLVKSALVCPEIIILAHA